MTLAVSLRGKMILGIGAILFLLICVYAVIALRAQGRHLLGMARREAELVGAVADRAVAYGIPGVTVDGNDVIAVYEAVHEALARARRGEGPSLVEGKTYRWMGHSMRAELAPYRSAEEEEEWLQRDPIARLEREMLDQQLITPERLACVRQEIEEELEEAVKFAERSPEPTVEVMERALYAPRLAVSAPPPKRGHELTFTEALNEALKQEMRRDPRVFVMGEDVGLIGGIFRVTQGLYDEFGADRARDTPISEATFVGCGLGAAVTGMRPVVDLNVVAQLGQAFIRQLCPTRAPPDQHLGAIPVPHFLAKPVRSDLVQ